MPLISPNFDVKSLIFSQFGQGPFRKIAGKSPEIAGCFALVGSSFCEFPFVYVFVGSCV